MKPIVLGLTGSIAMGKSTVGAMLENMSIPVHEADRCVHDLYHPDHPARRSIAAIFPIYGFPEIYEKKTGVIKRKALGDLVFARDDLRQALEDVLHPLVQQDQQEFISRHGRLGRRIVCLDVPLLFETGWQEYVDYTLVVSAPAAVQRQRVLERLGMSEEKLNAILMRQMPDLEKCNRADYVIHTGLGRAHTMKMLRNALLDIRRKSNLFSEESLCAESKMKENNGDEALMHSTGTGIVSLDAVDI
ncbi:MAG: dephospho-CoA kinase [Alphaproteobacteria bacterium]